jgi:hypothetical protein
MLKPAQKGEVRNPKGRPKNVFTIQELRNGIQAVLQCTSMFQLDKIIEDGTTHVSTKAAAAALKKGIVTGDWIFIEKLIERLFGKIKEETEHTYNFNMWTNEQLIAAIPEAMKVLKGETIEGEVVKE